jgi:hypothetical protein
MDELGRLKIRWALVDDKPERILEILHANPVTNTGYMHHRKYLTSGSYFLKFYSSHELFILFDLYKFMKSRRRFHLLTM